MANLSLDFVKEVAELLKASWKKGKRAGDEDLEKLNTYVKKHQPGDLKTLADSAISYFKQGKLKWDDFGMFQGKYEPGFDVIPWDYLKRFLKDVPEAVEKEMPKAFADKVTAKTFIEKVYAKYPHAKQCEHKGDSYMLYEAGGRDPLHPFSNQTFDKLVKETEGQDVDPEDADAACRNFDINTQSLKRNSGNFPDERDMNDSFGLGADERIAKRGTLNIQEKKPSSQPPLGYPTQRDSGMKALSQYEGKNMRFLKKVLARDTAKVDTVIDGTSIVDQLIQKDIEELKSDLEHAKTDGSEHYIERLLAVLLKEKAKFKTQRSLIEKSITGKSYQILREDLLLRVLHSLKNDGKRGVSRKHAGEVIRVMGGEFAKDKNGEYQFFGEDTAFADKVKKRYSKMQHEQDMKKLNALERYFVGGEKSLKTAIEWRDDPTKQKKAIVNGAEKLQPGKILAFNQLPGLTCPGKADCFNWCFALSGMTAMPTQMNAYAENFGLAERDDFVKRTDEQIKRMRDKRIIRVHCYGDFHSPKYAAKWMQIVKDNPDHEFYCYTKSFYMPIMKEWMKQIESGEVKNMKIIQSFGSKHDDMIDESKPHAKVFNSVEEMKKAGYVHCKDDDRVAADKKNIRVGILKHGNTPCAAGFCPVKYTTAAAGHHLPMAHLFDQVDAHEFWTDPTHNEEVQHLGAHLTQEEHMNDFGRHMVEEPANGSFVAKVMARIK